MSVKVYLDGDKDLLDLDSIATFSRLTPKILQAEETRRSLVTMPKNSRNE
jgi:hypothetical protein